MDLNAEVRCGYYVTSEMKKVWDIQLKMVSKLLEVCNKYHFKIWACGGTLIGVLRHKGYIPWDDDIDMVMMRDDYDKLISVSKEEFKNPFFFQTAYSETAPYSHGHAQLRMNGTTAILHGTEFMNIHLGIFIDIFVLDDVPSDDYSLNVMTEHIKKMKRPLEFRMANRVVLTTKMRVLFDSIKYRFMQTKKFKERYASIEKYIKSYSSEDCKSVLGVFFCQQESFIKQCKFNKEWYKDTLWMPFEDIMLPVPNGYHEILTQEYGDYMKPAKAPSMHGGFLVLDPDKDYKEYLPELRRQARKELFFKVLKKLHLKR